MHYSHSCTVIPDCMHACTIVIAVIPGKDSTIYCSAVGPYPAFEAWSGSQFATEADNPFLLLQMSRQPARSEEPPPYSEFAMEGHVTLMESPLQVSSHTADSVLPPMDMQGHRSSMELMQESGTYTDTDLDTSFLEESGGSTYYYPPYQRTRSLDQTPANNAFVRRASLPYGLPHTHFQEEPLSHSTAIFPTRPGASSTVWGTFNLPEPLPPLHTYPVSNSAPPIMSRLPLYRPPARLPPLQQQQGQVDSRQRKKRRRKRGHTWHGEGLPVPLQ